jgi:hypothetical protein
VKAQHGRIDLPAAEIRLMLVLGIAIPFVQFIFNRSLWHDEAMLGLNLVNRSPSDLLKPLDLLQVAPILFLEVEKFFLWLWPSSEMGLRVFPLLCSFLSLFFFYRILKKVLANKIAILLALSLYVFDSTLVYYSSEVKQYMSDVLVATVTCYLVLRDDRDHRLRFALLGLNGVLCIALSSIAPIILLCAGLCLAFEMVCSRREYLFPLVGLALVWVIAFGAYYLAFINNHPAREEMVRFWAAHEGFWLLNPLDRQFYVFLLHAFAGVFQYVLSPTLTAALRFGVYSFLLSLLFAWGLVRLAVKRRVREILLFALPLLVHLVLSGFHLYPWGTRLILYAAPGLIIVVASALDGLAETGLYRRFRLPFRSVALGLPVVALAVFLRQGFPFQHEELKKSLAFIRSHASEADAIYVYNGATPAFQYYRQTGQGIELKTIIQGGSHKDDRPAYLAELHAIDGRCWLLFSHVYQREDQFIIASMRAEGYEPVSTFATMGSSAYLFEFHRRTED